MTLFLSLLKRHRGLLSLGLLASLVSAAAGIGLLNEINRLIAGAVTMNTLLAAKFVGLLVLLFACGFGSQALLTALGHRVVYELRLQMVKRLLDTSIEQLEKIGEASLYATLSKDIVSIGQAFNRLPFVFYNTVLMLGGCLYMAWLSWQLLLICVVGLGLGTWLAHGWFNKMRQLMKRVRETDDRLYAAYQGAIEGRFELALNARRKERFYSLDLQPAAEYARRNEVHADRYWTLSLNWTVALILALAGGLFAAGTWLGLGNGVIAAFVLVLMFLRMPLNDLIGSLPTLVAGNVSLAKIETLAFADYRTEFTAQTGQADVRQPMLELQGLGYDYPHAADDYGFRLGPVDLSVAKGEILFIVGGNGSGKSTLAKLLTGLYEPSAGTLHLQGVEITPQLRDWYRAHFSTVFSSFYLFERLVGPNGDFDMDLAQAWLERLRMERKVTIDKQGGLSTTRLSQGQRKRLALLVALVEERPILLLDEWAADQDPGFRGFFYQELLPELKAQGKTIIAISHDDRYFSIADRVLKCDGGQLYPFDHSGADVEQHSAQGHCVPV
ncbi:putative ATP-binding cassette transporter [Pseudomonas brassicacearum]|uniref:ATP-binding cassette transporter n=1 Tax=Pseudomonas brassicacearum TaxID=930166 RepID=A0AAW8M8V0_9PSED|nr:cyclic peptide export ABC transporter [Pseudomonas brassicacearum]MDR6958098.1 putative ATP-binding cassette transporter [Pseudomonas brassicacearum]